MPNNIKGTQETSVVTWGNIHQHATDIALWIKNNIHGDVVNLYGIPRGGVIPAVMITYLLENMGVDVRLAHAINNLNPNDFRSLVVIDDICDSGDTFKMVKQLFPMAKTVTLFHRSTAKFVPDYFVEEVVTDNWLNFPWEVSYED